MVRIIDKVVKFQMKCIVSSAERPILFESCGNLISEDHFLHTRRVCESFVLIAVLRGTLYITQGKTPHAVGENQVLLLEAGVEHYGHRASEGYLSYYWMHFRFDGAYETVLEEGNFLPQGEDYVIPSQFCLDSSNRVTLLMVQLLDIARRDNFIVTRRGIYASSLVLLELTQEYVRQQNRRRQELPAGLNQVMEWIQAHYGQDITVGLVADRFGYHPTYLSALFKAHTGYPLIAYVNRLRISVSKNLLTNRSLKIYTIASMCGFSDEKRYMKLFKRYEGMTPSQYRQAFFQKKINQF